jgi:hypothetical protein
MLFVPAVSRTKAAPVIKNILNMVFLQTQYVKRPEWCQPEDGEIGELGRNWNEISQIGHVAGQEGWFTSADYHRQASGGKPPFLTCEFTRLNGAWAS